MQSNFNVNFYIGDTEEADIKLKEILKDYPEASIVRHEYDRFGIDEARSLREKNTISVADNTLHHILYIKVISGIAFEALLKTFEEPQKNTFYHIALKDTPAFKDTILSRVNVFNLKRSSAFSQDDMKKFIKLGLKKQEEFIKKNVVIDKEEYAQKIANTRDFLKGVMQYFQDHGNIELMKKIEQADRLINIEEANPKNVLFHLLLEIN